MRRHAGHEGAPHLGARCIRRVNTQRRLSCKIRCSDAMSPSRSAVAQSYSASCENTVTAVMQGPEIRTGFLEKPDEPLKFQTGDEVTITTDYEFKGNKEMIAMRCAGPGCVGSFMLDCP